MSKNKPPERKLTQKEQLEQDVEKFDQQIESMRNQLMQLVGAKTYAQAMLKQMEKGSKKEE